MMVFFALSPFTVQNLVTLTLRWHLNVENLVRIFLSMASAQCPCLCAHSMCLRAFHVSAQCTAGTLFFLVVLTTGV